MSYLLLRLPARAIALGDADRDLSRLPCAFALRTRHDATEREGYAPLADLAALIRDTGQLVVLVAAADVTLLHMAMPPLSAARLRAALPNLVEDKLLGDVADCVVVAAPLVDGLRSVAVMQRAWLAQISQTLRELGAQRISVLSEQVCLIQHDGQVTAAISEYGDNCALVLRLSEHDGLGLVQNSPEELLSSLRNLAPDSAITL
ncbi:MAG: type II secretion system protein GspL, partial [Sideroxydans sp.]